MPQRPVISSIMLHPLWTEGLLLLLASGVIAAEMLDHHVGLESTHLGGS